MSNTPDSTNALFGPAWPTMPIEWETQPDGDPASPFDRESRRPIRLTLHSQSFENLGGLENDAVDALVDLLELDCIDALDTGEGEHPRIIVEDPDEDGSNTVRVDYPDGSKLRTWLGSHGGQRRVPVQDETLVLAHRALGQDLFVTADPGILNNASDGLFRGSNVLPPSAAARIVGLLLRSRRNYEVFPHHSFRGGYQFYLMRYILHSLWRYFSACSNAPGKDEDSPSGLGGAILTRAERCMEARDAVGFEYYAGESGSIDAIEYHFDYLMLLLNGILDALARVAYLVYGLKTPKNASGRNFRSDQFRDGLRQSGAEKLVDVVEDNLALLRVVAGLRNTIHGSSLRGVRLNRTTPETFHLEVPVSLLSEFSQLDSLFGERYLGLNDDLFSPYAFSVAAVREVFRVVNEIADATQVERLFVDGEGPLMTGPPEDRGPFGRTTGRRMAAIGW